MLEAVPELKRFTFSSTIMKSVTCHWASDERVIEKFLETTRIELIQERIVPAMVENLHFTNYLLLHPSDILRWAGYCLILRELHCVNCLVYPSEIFRLLCLRLTCLKTLEWSLYDKVCRDVHGTVECMQKLPEIYRPKLEPPLRFRPRDIIQVNFVTLVKPAWSFNVFTLAGMVDRRMDLPSVQQTIVYLEDDSRISHLFSGASVIPESWKDVARLTLSLMARWCAPFSLPPVMHQGYVEPIRHFFQTCVSRITELNLTAFLFVFDVDECDLVGSTLPKF
ncbi:hypothetical protein MRX96_048191 [Rhipicephalus microplus]